MGVADEPILSAVEEDTAVEELERIGTIGKCTQGAVNDSVRCRGAVDSFGRANTVGVVGITNRCVAAIKGGKLSTVLPCESRAVCPAKRVADGVIGDGGGVFCSLFKHKELSLLFFENLLLRF